LPVKDKPEGVALKFIVVFAYDSSLFYPKRVFILLLLNKLTPHLNIAETLWRKLKYE
jgi:hypothetical protein